jgi:hypothetical protein
VEDSKKKQIKFEPEHSAESLDEEQHEVHSFVGLMSKGGNTRQTTLDEFFYIAIGSAKDRNVP